MEPPKLSLHSNTNDTPSTWTAQATPRQSQHSGASGVNFLILFGRGLPHNYIGIEQHSIRTSQQHTSHVQSSYSDAKLFRHAFWVHHKISRKCNDPPYPQRRILTFKSLIQEQSGKILLPQHFIIRSQQGPTKATATQCTSSCRMHNHEKRTYYCNGSRTGSPFCKLS